MVFVYFLVIFITLIIKIIANIITKIIIFIIKINLNLILYYALKHRFWGPKKGPPCSFRQGGGEGSELNGQCAFKTMFFSLDVVPKNHSTRTVFNVLAF